MTDIPSEIENAAALWVVKTTSRELTKQESQEFERWIAASEQHQETYYRARQLWVLTHSGNTVVTVKRKQSVWRYGKQSLVATVLLAIFFSFFWLYNHQSTADYYTKTGEIRQITLPDGSVVDLDSGTQISLAFDTDYRQVNLIEGRAYFTVAPTNPRELRPFRVIANNGAIQALGTEFSIENRDSDVEVNVYQHSVQVSLLSGQSEVVNQGYSTHYQQKIWPVTAVKNNHSSAWREGQIIFHQRALKDVISEINRYRNKPIILLSKRNEKVSGVFQVKGLESAIENLNKSHDLAAYEVPFFTLIY